MKAVATITESNIATATPAGHVTIVTQFGTDGDPRTGIVVKNIPVAYTEAQISFVLKQAIVEYINGKRGENVINVADVRLV